MPSMYSKKRSFPRQLERLARDLRQAATYNRHAAFEDIIRSIPRGRVATYGQVADAAGYPRGHRQVAQFLRAVSVDDIPWQRVIGACGIIKISGSGGARQQALLKLEGVICQRGRVDMEKYGHVFE